MGLFGIGLSPPSLSYVSVFISLDLTFPQPQCPLSENPYLMSARVGSVAGGAEGPPATRLQQVLMIGRECELFGRPWRQSDIFIVGYLSEMVNRLRHGEQCLREP